MTIRPRRIRKNQIIRDLVSEIVLDKKKLIMPHFVEEGVNIRINISSMDGIERCSIDNFLIDVEKDYKIGINAIIIFGIPKSKDSQGTEAYAEKGITQEAVRAVKNKFPDLFVITDVCMCEYTDHGHCGIIENSTVLNDPTLDLLAQVALSHAKAGVDMVAPSDMMDGRVAAIRNILDKNKFKDLPIMAYSAKYSSAFYGPFRDAAGSSPTFGDRRSYQMDYRNSKEAEKEVNLDIEEGADIVMVKPAVSYLDSINKTKEVSNVPVCAYNVSGEYSMVKAMAKLGYADEKALVEEILTSLFRAGSDMIISYHTRDIYKNNWF